MPLKSQIMKDESADHDDDAAEPLTVGQLLDDMPDSAHIERLVDVVVPEMLKDPFDECELAYREFDSSPRWKRIPAFKDVSRDQFLDYAFQNRQTVTTIEQLTTVLRDLAEDDFIEDVMAGMQMAPMNLRLSPYILSLIDWDEPHTDPLRIQFIPTASTYVPDHPMLSFDSLHEQEDSPTPGLVHRYPTKALFLAIDVCPVYCRFCTRSYAIGGDTDTVSKTRYAPSSGRWDQVFAYIISRPDIEDIVVSGGDTYMLSSKHIRHIGETLLAIPHVRRIRFATKGPSVMPMKLISDTDWTDALVEMADLGRQQHKEVCLHTHFNCPGEITALTRIAMNRLFKRGVTVRNQSVLIRGVNDTPETMIELIRQLSYMNVQPYYVYQHDMVSGVEEFRTRVADAVELEKNVRGATAGYNTPTFVNDVPGGGGKRDVHSFDYYDRVTGVSVYRSPVVNPDKVYLYYDPLHLLPEEGRRRWADYGEHKAIIDEAIAAAGLEELELA